MGAVEGREVTPAALHEVPRVVPSPTTLAEAVAFYAEFGLPVTPVRPGDKKGYKKGWSLPGHSATLADFRAADNVGVLNGTAHEPEPDWFFHDVDIDANSDAARRIVERLLPPTGWRYGRASKPRSHANYLVKGQLRTRKYLGRNGKAILELRGITQKKTHVLSVAPGSTHESGEAIRFCEPRGDIGLVDDAVAFDRAVQHAAVGIVLVHDWPASGRHNLRLAFAKVLHEHGLSPADSIALLEAVMEATGSNVSDVAECVRATAEAIQAGQPTAGASLIREVFGDEVGDGILNAIRKLLRSDSVDDATSVVMKGGDLSHVVNRAETALLTLPIYQRGGMLTRAIRLDLALDVADKDAVRRSAGSTMLIAVREPWLLEQMGRTLKWFAPSEKRGVTPADPKPIYARTLLSRAEWRFPVLRGVVTAPTLDRDGRIIETPGFDEASGLLLDFAPDVFPPIPAQPTRDEARAALDVLAHPLRAFPFVDGAARSVSLSAVLTALVRPSLRTSPLIGYDAPTAGTGKSLLAEGVGLLATGFRPPALSQGKSDEEDEKRLATVLFAGDAVIHIDNCERPIAGDFLCSLLTQEIVQARILGLSERRVLPSTALVLATGNNLAFAGDTSRRAVVCRLDAELERPDTRAFDFDVHAEVLAARPALVVAGLTVLRAYAVAGRPVSLTPMGSFTDWEWIRGALVWLGCADPADPRAAILDNDPRKNDLLEVMDLWASSVGSEFTDVATLTVKADAELETTAGGYRDLRAKLIEIACRGGKWSSVSVGRWLQRHKDRVIGNRCFTCRPGTNHVMTWKLTERVTDGQPRLPSTS